MRAKCARGSLKIQLSAFSYRDQPSKKFFLKKVGRNSINSSKKNSLRVPTGVRTTPGQAPDTPQTNGTTDVKIVFQGQRALSTQHRRRSRRCERRMQPHRSRRA